MSLYTRTLAAARAAREAFQGRASKRPAEDPPPGWAPWSAVGLHSIALPGLRSVLDAHDAGQFFDSGLLSESFLRSPYVAQALRQRTLSVLGAPLCVEGSDPAIAAEVQTLWPRVCPRAVEGDLLRSACMLGFGVARVTHVWAEDLGDWLPRLRAWHPSNVYFNAAEETWYALTRAGVVPITPGNGWVLYTPESEARPWIYGAVRATGEWVFSLEQNSRNARRHSEVLGQGVWLAKTPPNTSDKDARKRFMDAVRNMGRAAVIELPQGTGDGNSYDLTLTEPKGEGWEGFQWLHRTCASAIRLVLLGQDLTSEHGDVGKVGSSAVGDSVREDLALDDAQGEGECLSEQLLGPWVRWRYGDSVKLAVRRGVQRKQDELKLAQAQQARATAANTVAAALPGLLEQAAKAGVQVDVEELLEGAGVPVLEADEEADD